MILRTKLRATPKWYVWVLEKCTGNIAIVTNMYFFRCLYYEWDNGSILYSKFEAPFGCTNTLIKALVSCHSWPSVQMSITVSSILNVAGSNVTRAPCSLTDKLILLINTSSWVTKENWNSKVLGGIEFTGDFLPENCPDQQITYFLIN